MKELVGDLWQYWTDLNPVCITVNGYVRPDGCAVMGRGTAAQAVKRIPELPKILGKRIQRCGWHNVFHIAPYILSFPVKRDYGFCDSDNVVSHMAHRFEIGDSVPGWALKAEIEVIAESLSQLRDWSVDGKWPRIVLPRPGCGAGELDWKTQVKPLCAEYGDWLWVITKL